MQFLYFIFFGAILVLYYLPARYGYLVFYKEISVSFLSVCFVTNSISFSSNLFFSHVPSTFSNSQALSNYFLFGLAVLCSLNTLTHHTCMAIFRMLRLSLVFVFLVFQVCEKDNINTDPVFEQKPCKIENNNKPQISTYDIL